MTVAPASSSSAPGTFAHGRNGARVVDDPGARARDDLDLLVCQAGGMREERIGAEDAKSSWANFTVPRVCPSCVNSEAGPLRRTRATVCACARAPQVRGASGARARDDASGNIIAMFAAVRRAVPASISVSQTANCRRSSPGPRRRRRQARSAGGRPRRADGEDPAHADRGTPRRTRRRNGSSVRMMLSPPPKKRHAGRHAEAQPLQRREPRLGAPELHGGAPRRLLAGLVPTSLRSLPRLFTRPCPAWPWPSMRPGITTFRLASMTRRA